MFSSLWMICLQPWSVSFSLCSIPRPRAVLVCNRCSVNECTMLPFTDSLPCLRKSHPWRPSPTSSPSILPLLTAIQPGQPEYAKLFPTSSQLWPLELPLMGTLLLDISLADLSHPSRLYSNITSLMRPFLAVLAKIAPVPACSHFGIFMQGIWHNYKSKDAGYVELFQVVLME